MSRSPLQPNMACFFRFWLWHKDIHGWACRTGSDARSTNTMCPQAFMYLVLSTELWATDIVREQDIGFASCGGFGRRQIWLPCWTASHKNSHNAPPFRSRRHPGLPLVNTGTHLALLCSIQHITTPSRARGRPGIFMSEGYDVIELDLVSVSRRDWPEPIFWTVPLDFIRNLLRDNFWDEYVATEGARALVCEPIASRCEACAVTGRAAGVPSTIA